MAESIQRRCLMALAVSGMMSLMKKERAMPTRVLTQAWVERQPLCPAGQAKVDYFDQKTTGLLLKVLASGRKTWYLRYTSPAGRRREKKLASAAVLPLAQARQLAKRHLVSLAHGKDPFEHQERAQPAPTLAAFVEKSYLPYIRSRKRSWQTDETLLRVHILPYWGNYPLNQITHELAIKRLGEHRATHKPASTNRVFDMLNALFNLAIRWKRGITTHPLTHVQRYQANNKRERYLNQAEAARLFTALEHTTAPRLKPIVTMLLLTGARLSEVLNARWADFDVASKRWTIEINKSGKTRYVPLSEPAIGLLERLSRTPGCPYPFANPRTARPYTSIQYPWDRVRRAAGLADLRIHDLRHSFASFLVNGGRSIYEVQKILGHTQISTTQRYAHLSQETLVEAANVATRQLPL